jgi:hypothetical protein
MDLPKTFLILWTLIAPTIAHSLTDEERVAFACKQAKALYRKYPPEKFYIIGLGRTVGTTFLCMRHLYGDTIDSSRWVNF